MGKTSRLTTYRWAILAISCCINLCIGSLYTWSVFAGPMAEQLTQISGNTITSSDLSIVFSLANILGPVTMIFGGSFNDRVGPSKVMLVGGVLFGSGLIVSGFAQSVGVLILGYSMLCGLGMSLVYGCTIGNSVKFFPDNRGLAGGLATASYGLSSVLLPIVSNALIQSVGIRSTFKILGAVFMAVIVIGSRFILHCPTDFCPEGWKPDTRPGLAPAHVEKTWRQMLSDPLFYLLLAQLTLGASAGMMIISQASALSQSMMGMSVGSAAAMVSILALFNSSGRVSAGILSDKLGRMRVLAAALGIGLAGLILMLFLASKNVVLFIIGIGSVGISFGSLLGLFPSITADYFGARNNSVNYGFMFIGIASAGLLGPAIMRTFLASTGSYRPSFIAAGALTVLGLLIHLLCLRFIHARVAKENNMEFNK